MGRDTWKQLQALSRRPCGRRRDPRAVEQPGAKRRVRKTAEGDRLTGPGRDLVRRGHGRSQTWVPAAACTRQTLLHRVGCRAHTGGRGTRTWSHVSDPPLSACLDGLCRGHGSHTARSGSSRTKHTAGGRKESWQPAGPGSSQGWRCGPAPQLRRAAPRFRTDPACASSPRDGPRKPWSRPCRRPHRWWPSPEQQ